MIRAGRQISGRRPALAEWWVERGGVLGRGSAVVAERRVRLALGRAGVPWEALNSELAARLLVAPSAVLRLPAWVAPVDTMRRHFAVRAASGMTEVSSDSTPALRDSSSFDPQHILTDLLPHGRGLNLGRRSPNVERGQVLIPGTSEAELDRLVTWAPITDGPVTLGTTLRLALDAYYARSLDERREASFPFVEVWMLGDDDPGRWGRAPVPALMQFDGAIFVEHSEARPGLAQMPNRPPFLRLHWPAGQRVWDRFPLVNRHAVYRELREDGHVFMHLVSTAPIPDYEQMARAIRATPDYTRLLRGSRGLRYKDLFYLALWLQGDPALAAAERVPERVLLSDRDDPSVASRQRVRQRWSEIVRRLQPWLERHPDVMMPGDYAATPGPTAPAPSPVPAPAPATQTTLVDQAAARIVAANPRQADAVAKWREAMASTNATIGEVSELMRHYLRWRLQQRNAMEWQRMASPGARPLVLATLEGLSATEVEQLVGGTMIHVLETLAARTLVQTLEDANADARTSGQPALGFDREQLMAMISLGDLGQLNSGNQLGRRLTYTWHRTVKGWLDAYVVPLRGGISLAPEARRTLASNLLAAMHTWPAQAAGIRAQHAELE